MLLLVRQSLPNTQDLAGDELFYKQLCSNDLCRTNDIYVSGQLLGLLISASIDAPGQAYLV